MTGLMMEDFMEEVPFKLGRRLGFTVGDGCGTGASGPGIAKRLQQKPPMMSKPNICIGDSEWFNLTNILHVLYSEYSKVRLGQKKKGP